jgi:HPt (histidine-containing phosphotransfer) domain-containing protein
MEGTQQDDAQGLVLDPAIFSAMATKFQPDVLRDIYTMTLDDVAQRLKRIEALTAAGDLDAIRREAHAIKGGCAWVGARELAQLAAAAEQATTLNTPALADFPSACDRLRRKLDAVLQP